MKREVAIADAMIDAACKLDPDVGEMLNACGMVLELILDQFPPAARRSAVMHWRAQLRRIYPEEQEAIH